ncbi:MAG: acetate--CoA ligase [Legionellaceae bacterium]|nr:acetate--CoA ligase [Legionellaceae bacterium]
MENASSYIEKSQLATQNPLKYWEDEALENISWISKWSEIFKGEFAEGSGRWFVGATLNACYNCVDRHLKDNSEKNAILWEGNNPEDSKCLTYSELHQEICKFSNVLKSLGVKKGDRVCIYMPMIPEAIIAMLSCARIGAIHSVVFAGFSAEALSSRILDSNCSLVITADSSVRGEKSILLKDSVDKALEDCPCVKDVVVVQYTNHPIKWKKDRDIWYHQACEKASSFCEVEPMLATDPLFILYTSGSTGKPKGVLHTTGGYMVHVATTFKQVFNYNQEDVYWCGADIGWITGHSYIVYGPMANCATTIIFDGVPNFPTYSRYWEIIDKYQVNQFYTSPTALRSLRSVGDEYVNNSSRKSLKLLGVVGEPLNPDVWEWFYNVIGEKRCPIINTWWQTETGGIMLTPPPKLNSISKGSAGVPVLGVEPEIVNDNGVSVLHTNQVGHLVIKNPWPGMMQTIYGDNERFVNTYFKEIPGFYYTGDGAYTDTYGNYCITGRNDDVIKVSGHRIGTEELESAFVSHPDVAEAAVVGVPHPIKGESIYAFVTLKSDVEETIVLNKELIQYIRDKIGPFAMPEVIQWTASLPKTRSGKIMRRILKKIANKQFDNLGDISTLADETVVLQIIKDIK